MAITKHNILKHELIGLEIKITKSKNDSLIGLHGKIVNETRNTLTISSGERLKKVLKAHIVFQASINGQSIEIDGKKLAARPEERIKK